MNDKHTIIPCLWFDTQAEEAAKFYTSLFPNSKVGKILRYGKEGIEIHKKPVGSVLTVEFTLDGIPPKFSEIIKNFSIILTTLLAKPRSYSV